MGVMVLPPKTFRASLREERVSGFAPHDGNRVDRNIGCIYGVKIVGLSSPNSHGIKRADGRPVDGTDYEELALKNALKLYEGTGSNVDHPPANQRTAERSARDGFGWVESVVMREDGLYGNYRFLDPKDPLAIKVMNAAELKPDSFALSHDAEGVGEVVGGRFVVKKITEVRSVDLVRYGGTNISLFESSEAAMKIKFADAGKKYAKLAPFVRLFEAGGDIGKRLLEAEGEDTGDYRDHLHQARKMCEDAGDEEMAGKIHRLMSPKKEEKEDESEQETAVEEDDAMEDEEHARPAGEKGGEDTPKAKTADEVKESRRRKRSKDPHVRQLQERLDLAELKEWVRKRCDEKEIPCTDKLLSTLVILREHKAIDSHLEFLAANGVKKAKLDTRQPPRVQSPYTPLRESQEDPPKNLDDFVARLRR
jgi:hypothetical protein